MREPVLLVVFYGNPAMYPPTCNAVRLLSQRFKVTVIGRNVDPATTELPDGVDLIKVGPYGTTRDRALKPTSTKLLEYARFIKEVRRAYRRNPPDVVLAYDPHALVAVKVAGCRCPLVYQRHEVEELDPPRLRTFGEGIAALARRMSRDVDLLLFPEQKRADYYQQFVADCPVPLIVPNFPLKSIFERPSDWSGLIDERWQNKEVFYRGSIGPATGVHELVRALPHMPTQSRVRICGFGPPEFAAMLDEVATNSGCAARYTNDGFIQSYEALNATTQKASIGVMLYQPVSTSTRHTAAATNKIYEYAACGLPVIAPNHPGFRELLGCEDWVAFADESDPISIAEAVQSHFKDPDRYRRRCAAAREAFERKYNYETVFQPAFERILRLAERPLRASA